ncbi:MAG: protein kinase family protein [Deltaproteobacteria bacterium]|nr:protein kinase family protein [Deltaproteobacteria bacterium]
MKNTKKQHLELVSRPEASTYQKQVVGVENLSSAQRKAIERYSLSIQPEGTFVGALEGKDPWDVRPIYLHEHQLYLIRLSDPSWALNRKKLNTIRSLYFHSLADQDSPLRVEAYGELEGQLWIKRKFYPYTLSDLPLDQEGFLSFHPVYQAEKIIALVENMHRTGVIHGHLSLSNIAIEDEPIFLDHGFGALSGENFSDLAPEIHGGSPATIAADIYGLGMILKSLLEGYLGKEHQDFLQRMLSYEPQLRPNILSVKEMFTTARENRSVVTQFEATQQKTIKHGSIINVTKNEPVQEFALNTRSTIEFVANHTPTIDKTEPVPEQTVQAPEKQSLPLSFIRIGTFTALVSLFVGLGIYYVQNDYKTEDTSHYSSYWLSKQTPLMKEVFDAAVIENSVSAQSVIIRAALDNQKLPKVKNTFLKIAFHPLWSEELSPQDRKIAIALSSSLTSPEVLQTLPPLSEVHPGILFGLLTEVKSDSSALSKVPIEALADLKSPFGETFARLAKLGVKNLGEPEVRGLAQLLIGSVTGQSVKLYLSSTTYRKIDILLPYIEAQDKEFSDKLFSILTKADSLKIPSIEWYQDSPSVVSWDKVNSKTKLLLVGGKFPTGLSLEQYLDLLSYPIASIRIEAAKIIERTIPKASRPILSILAETGAHLDREQILTLVSALSLDGKKAYLYIDKWFSDKPGAEIVLELLLARNKASSNDYFNLQAARYLAYQDLNIETKKLKQMMTHPEQLARALAYSKLAISDPEHMRLLDRLVDIEPSAKLRKQMVEKLEEAGYR